MDSSTAISSGTRHHLRVQHQAQPQGLGVSLNPKPLKSSRPSIRRQWTMCKAGRRRGPNPSAALPFPFMEISVSVVDSMDMLRSSFEEEIVFQATMQVPAHHAIACRIQAYDTPFANAPTLKDAAGQQLSEADQEFAACLASPPDLEEAPSFTFSRTASLFQRREPLQQQAPKLRAAASGSFVTMTLSMKQRARSNQHKDHELDDDVPEEEEAAAAAAADTHNSLDLRQSSSNNMALHQQQLLQQGPTGAHAGAAAAAGAEQQQATAGNVQSQAGGEAADDGAFARGLSHIKTRGLMRIESFSPAGRKCEEVAIDARPGGTCVASLLGLGYMMLHHWQSRMEPARGLLKTHINAFTGVHPGSHLTVGGSAVHSRGNQLHVN